MSINVQKNLKNASFFKKNDKILDVKILEKNSITSRNYTVTYHQTLEQASWLLRLLNLRTNKKISKTLKKFASFFKKIAKIRGVETLKPFYYL